VSGVETSHERLLRLGNSLPDTRFIETRTGLASEAPAQPGDFKLWRAADVTRMLGYPDLAAMNGNANNPRVLRPRRTS